MRPLPSCLPIAVLFAGACTEAGSGRPETSRAGVVVPNDNRSPAGIRRGDTLVLHLSTASARWFPAGESDTSVVVTAFAADGGAPSIPGPLVRVELGSKVRIEVRNTLPSDTLALCPLWSLACRGPSVVRIPPGDRGAWSFTANRWGATMYRAGIVRGERVFERSFGSQLSGALVVDSATTGPDRDRIFVINTWNHPGDTNRFVQTLNGRTWPHTERIALSVGDSTRWRLLNGGPTEHPMHLHGFYFRVDSRGDVTGDTLYAPAERELAVTETLRPWGVATIAWSPTRGGNWLFHCHKTVHMSGVQHEFLSGVKAATPGTHTTDPAAHLSRDMGGLILGVDVKGDVRADLRPGPGAAIAATRMHLRIVETPEFYRGASGYSFVLDDGGVPGPGDAGRRAAPVIPGPMLLLRRDVPVEIVVTNTLQSATTVHWHGIELESYFDGVAGWSGVKGSVTPMIAPSDSFVARFTPPRSGTFMYHAHVDETKQLNSGLYAPIVVLEPGERWDPSRDHVLLFSQGGPDDEALVLVNGKMPADTLQLSGGVPHRLRLINITTMDEVTGELRAGDAVGEWRVLAKDGAAFPPSKTSPRPARFHLGAGEIVDVELQPVPGIRELRVKTFNDFTIPVRTR